MEVEVVDRNFDARKKPHDKSVILMSWTDQGGKSSINFMESRNSIVEKVIDNTMKHF